VRSALAEECGKPAVAYDAGHSVFAFNVDGPCRGFQEVLARYNAITPHVQLSGTVRPPPRTGRAWRPRC
jgi:hypothetical protein